jgi:DNA repair exonuclease SbcCD ATPase subunit
MKNVTFHSIELITFQGYGTERNTIRLDTPGIIRLLGTNGAGKSSLIVALETALFNDNEKQLPLADLANSKVGKGFKITVEFSVEGKNYRVENCREYQLKKNTSITLYEDGIDISSHTMPDTLSQIEAILGADLKTFDSLVSVTAANVAPLLYGTDGAAREFITRLWTLDKYDRMYKAVSDELSEVEKELNDVTTNGKMRAVEVQTMEKNLDSIKVPEYKDAQALQDILNSLKDRMSDHAALLAKVRAERAAIPAVSSTILNTEAALLTEREQLQCYIDTRTLPDIALQDAQIRSAELNSTIGKLSRALAVEGSVCPLCFSKPDMEHLRSERDRLQIEQKQLSLDIATLQKDLKERERVKEIDAKLVKVHEAKALLAKDSALGDQIAEIEAEVGDTPQLIKDVERELILAIASNNSREERLRAIEKLNVAIDEKKLEVEGLRVEYDTITKRRERLLRLKTIYSPKGIKAFKIEQILLDINRELNREGGCLDLLSGGTLSAKLVPMKLSKKGGPTEKITVIVADPDKELPFAAWSEGEKKQVALALTMVIHEISPVSLNLLMLDEVTGNLAPEKRRQLFDILPKMTYSTDKTIFVVSHDDLEEDELLFTDVYKFRKINGFCGCDHEDPTRL